MNLDDDPAPKHQMLAESSHQQLIDAAFERIDLATWLFSLPTGEYRHCCEPDHIACGVSTTEDGQPMSITVETLGGDLLIQHYIAHVHRADRCKLVSISDVFLPSGARTTAKLTWTMSVEAVDDLHSLYTNTVVAEPTAAFLEHLEGADVPLAAAAAALQAAGDDHGKRETRAFAASIERHATGR